MHLGTVPRFQEVVPIFMSTNMIISVLRQGPLTCAGFFAIMAVLSNRNKEPFVSRSSERKRELRRRRHRKKKISILLRKLEKATVSERGLIAEKLRALTPGGEQIIARLDLEKR